MEFDDDNATDTHDGESVEIYSRKAIFWFAFLASSLFGGVLLMLNLKAAGYKRAMYNVLAFVILFEISSELLLFNYLRYYKIDLLAFQKKMSYYKPGDNIYDEKIMLYCVIGIALKIAGALVLSRLFFNKYFPDNDYYPRSITSAFFATIIIFLLLQIMGIAI